MVNRRADRPVYRQLADLLRGQIASGQLRPGERLPSEQRLAQEHGIGRDSVRAAVAELRAEGLVTTDVPIGTVVRPEQPRSEYSLQRGSQVALRMPTPAERDELGLSEGVPVAVITYGARTRVVPGDRWVFIVK